MITIWYATLNMNTTELAIPFADSLTEEHIYWFEHREQLLDASEWLNVSLLTDRWRDGPEASDVLLRSDRGNLLLEVTDLILVSFRSTPLCSQQDVLMAEVQLEEHAIGSFHMPMAYYWIIENRFDTLAEGIARAYRTELLFHPWISI